MLYTISTSAEDTFSKIPVEVYIYSKKFYFFSKIIKYAVGIALIVSLFATFYIWLEYFKIKKTVKYDSFRVKMNLK